MNLSPTEIAEKISTTGFLLGQRFGLDMAAKLLLDESAEMFRRRRDDEARLLRDLSDKLMQKEKEQRQIWEEQYRPQREQFFAMLTAYEENTDWQSIGADDTREEEG
jgi:hypothetical protein